LDQILVIWSHQLDSANDDDDDDRIVFGRGSPEMDFKPTIANKQVKKRFQGSLPTSIYHERKMCEVFGKAPDIDSTALMISTTSWILSRLFTKNASIDSSKKSSVPDSLNRVQKVLDFTIPKMHKAVDYLTNRDIDNDGLLEQSHNEDWMDSIMRAGKIVYSQACWILALSNFSLLLQLQQKKQERSIEEMVKLADATIKAIEEKLWSEEDDAYIDVQETHHIGGPYRTLTQDVSLYLVAISENSSRGNLTNNSEQGLPREKTEDDDLNLHRSNRTLDALKNRVWKEKWPLVTEVELKSTGPWILKPYQYHNLTFWPWTTGIEMLARSRFDRVEECNLLLSTLTSESSLHMLAFYEWINPITDEGNGAFPFRTGISAVRISVVDILNNIRRRLSAEA
jgi:hypothetical protein